MRVDATCSEDQGWILQRGEFWLKTSSSESLWGRKLFAVLEKEQGSQGD